MPASIQPTLCRVHEQGDTGDCIVEAKVDGVRAIVEVEAGEVRAYTRNGTVIDLPYDTASAAASIGHPVIDCELVGDVLHVFDLPAFGGSWRVRRAVLDHAFAKAPESDKLRLVPVLHDPALDNGYPEDTQTIMDRAVAAGYEGIVLKDPEAGYVQGERVWAKAKPEHTEDLRVVDVMRNGSLVVSRKGVKVVVGIGLSRNVRSAGAAMLGRLVEVRYQEITAAGSLRHPVLVRVRDDKNEVN